MSGFNKKPFKPQSGKPFTKTGRTATAEPSTPSLRDMSWLQNPNLPDGQSVDLDYINDTGKTGGGELANIFNQFLNSAGMTNIDQSTLAGIVQFLNAYLSQPGQRTSERNDMLLQLMLQFLNSNDQRAFDLKQLQDSRLYNSPTNELARMLGAGISRDAAIQMLSGSAGNIAGVAGSVGAAPPNMPAPSGTMDLQQKQFAVGTAQSAVAMLGQLIDSGLSLAQGVESVKAMQGANYFSQAQMQGFSSANEFVNMLQTKIAAGEIDSAEVEKLSNGKDLIKYLQKIAPTNESVAELLNSNAYKGTFGSIYGRQFYNDFWSSVRSSRDSGTLADEFIRSQHLNNDIAALQPTKIAAEIEAIGQANKESEQRIVESCTRVAQGEAQIEVLNAQGEWIRVQTELYPELTQTQIDLNEANAAVARTTNKQLSLNYEYNAAGFPMLKQNRIDELTIKAESWSAIKKYYNNDMRDINGQTPKERYLDAQVRAWLQSPENAADAAYLQSIYLNAAGDFATQHPGLYGLSSVFQQLGVFDLIKTVGETGVAVSKFL